VDADQSWHVIEQKRRSLADLLDTLSDDEWERPSLCVGWRIRDVAAHLALAAQPPGLGSMLRQGVRARGSFHRLNHDAAVRHAERPGADLVAELREHAASRELPFVTNHRNILFDVLVHEQDIALPLGHSRQMPSDAAAAGATRVWTMGWPFWAKHRLRGFRFTATDADWSAGAGVDVRGPITGVLLVLTGRPAGLPLLSGPEAGLTELDARLRRPLQHR
jgi:uncharacterized protein (TIGR03083 family)